jgi:hypothetical protein
VGERDRVAIRVLGREPLAASILIGLYVHKMMMPV